MSRDLSSAARFGLSALAVVLSAFAELTGRLPVGLALPAALLASCTLYLEAVDEIDWVDGGFCGSTLGRWRAPIRSVQAVAPWGTAVALELDGRTVFVAEGIATQLVTAIGGPPAPPFAMEGRVDPGAVVHFALGASCPIVLLVSSARSGVLPVGTIVVAVCLALGSILLLVEARRGLGCSLDDEGLSVGGDTISWSKVGLVSPGRVFPWRVRVRSGSRVVVVNLMFHAGRARVLSAMAHRVRGEVSSATTAE